MEAKNAYVLTSFQDRSVLQNVFQIYGIKKETWLNNLDKYIFKRKDPQGELIEQIKK